VEAATKDMVEMMMLTL